MHQQRTFATVSLKVSFLHSFISLFLSSFSVRFFQIFSTFLFYPLEIDPDLWRNVSVMFSLAWKRKILIISFYRENTTLREIIIIIFDKIRKGRKRGGEKDYGDTLDRKEKKLPDIYIINWPQNENSTCWCTFLGPPRDINLNLKLVGWSKWHALYYIHLHVHIWCL